MRASRRAPLAARCLLLIVIFSGCAVLIHGKSASSLVLGRTRTSAAPSVETPVDKDKIEETVDDKEDEEVTTLPPGNITTKSPLTGNPNIDYQFDPNLPRELNGQNLTDYPFFNSVPENIDFKCDGLKDGFYASVTHKCQLYHHCLYGTRYDFLCANYTAFDQRTFICHFVSEVDCVNSPKFFNRNEALYKQDSTTVATTSTTSTTTTPSPAQDNGGRSRGGSNGGRRRRPFRRRRPVQDYYEYDDYEDDFDYYQDEAPMRRPSGGSRRRKRPENRQRPSAPADDDYDVDSPPQRQNNKPEKPTEEPPLPTKPNRAVFEKPRAPPRIRPPVPVNERDKFARPGEFEDKQERSRNNNKQRPSDSEYYDDYEDAPAQPPPRKKQKPPPEDDEYAVEDDFRRTPPQGSNGRPLRRNRGPTRQRQRPYASDDDDMDYREDSRRKRPGRRPDDYEDEDEPPRRKEEEAPRRKRPGSSRPSDDTSPAGSQSQRTRSHFKSQYNDFEEGDAPVRSRPQPRKSSTTTTSTTTTTTTTTTTPRPRAEFSKRPRKPSSTTPAPLDDDYYYDDYPIKSEEEEKSKPVPQISKPSTEKEVIQEVTSTTVAPVTKRPPFTPSRPKSQENKEELATRSPLRFQIKNIPEETEEKPFEFVLDDYIKPTTRPPFIPRSKAPPQSAAETPARTEAPAKPAAFAPPRQKAPAVVPTVEYDDYPSEPVKPAPRPAPVQRVPATKLMAPEIKDEVTSLRTSSRNQYKTITAEPDFSSYAEIKPATRTPQYSQRPKIPSLDFTSPGAEELQRTTQRFKLGTPPSDISNKFPAPPPRSRLPTSFLPRGLSPVGGARSKSTTPASILDIEDEEDDAINDALHPTGADVSSTAPSSRFNPYQSRSRLPVASQSATSSRYSDETTSASQSSYSSLPLYDDEEEPEPLPKVSSGFRDSYRPQIPVQYAPTAVESFARHPAPSNYRGPPLRPQQFRDPPRNERRPAASSVVQYATQQEPSTSWANSRDYFYSSY